MIEINQSLDDTVNVKVWVTKGNSMNYNSYCLPSDDPDSAYQQIIAQGARPEDYGIFSDEEEKFHGWGRQRLIDEVTKLRKEIDTLERHYAGN